MISTLPVDYRTLEWADRKAVREAYASLQHGMCKHCWNPLSGQPAGRILELEVDEKLFPKNFFKHPVHLHHNHDTGMTIGAVHSRCNAVLWQYHGE